MMWSWLILAPMEPPSSGPSFAPQIKTVSAYLVKSDFRYRVMTVIFAPRSRSDHGRGHRLHVGVDDVADLRGDVQEAPLRLFRGDHGISNA